MLAVDAEILSASSIDEVDARFMSVALEEARLAFEAGEVPVGAVGVFRGEVIARAHNRRERDQDPTAHAELMVVKQCATLLGTWRLSEVTVYVTLEPCPMCAGALVNSRVERVVFGATDPKAGATQTLYPIGSDLRLNHRFELRSGVMEEPCGALLSDFFGRIRSARKQNKLGLPISVLPPAKPKMGE